MWRAASFIASLVLTSLESRVVMAINKGGRRVGAIRGRTQFRLPSGHYAKRDRRTGEILSIKADKKPYKNVIIERAPVMIPERTAQPGDGATLRILPLPLDRAA
jgi:hypothetical protein